MRPTAGGIAAVRGGRYTHAGPSRPEHRPDCRVDQRDVLVLRLLGDKSYKRDRRAITGKKIGTVGWLVSVGLKALSQELEPLLSGVPAKAPRVVAEPGMGFGLVQGELS